MMSIQCYVRDIRYQYVVFALLAACVLAAEPARHTDTFREWRVSAGTPAGMRYSSLKQINRSNVSGLKMAWRFDSHDEFHGSEMQCNPIVVNGVLYATTPQLRVVALNAATGRLIWRFNAEAPGEATRKRVNRGVAYWQEHADRRILFTVGNYLYAIDAMSGARIRSFGQGGRVDLREGLGREISSITISDTSPGMVYRDLIILGSTLPEDLPCAPGDIRAYDVRSGRIRWTFHTIPHPGEFGYDTWPRDAWKTSGAANNWAGMCLDEERGIVFVPTGSPASDFYGADRVGDDLFGNSLVALQAATGERIWHFQVVKHDLWDRDLPAPPTLVTVKRDGKRIDAVAQITKSGFVFVFDRQSGAPLFPIKYRSVPRSDVEGEVTAERQPFPLLPPAFARQNLTEDLVTDRTPQAHDAVLAQLHQFRFGGQFIPPGLQGIVMFPCLDGGGEWGGAAFDPDTGLLYVNANERAQIVRLIERPKAAGSQTGRDLYLARCAGCHRADRTGGDYPSLAGVGAKYTSAEIAGIVRNGTGRMPAFNATLSDQAIRAIAAYVAEGRNETVTQAGGSVFTNTLKYKMERYGWRLEDPDGYPGIKPPWGTLNAIDLNSGRIAWKTPLGEIPELARQGLKNTGSDNYGGPVVTAGGLVFIGATNYDQKFHAFDARTGALLWESILPAAGNATPAVYEMDGREYVVIAAGGGKNGAVSGGSYVAFSLP